MSDAAFPLRGKTVMVGVAGGIAAYKAVELVRLLTKADCTVQVVMTERARHFVGELTFQALTGRPVFTDLFNLTQESEIGHIEVADRADLVIVAPATANVIARMAAGMADDALTSVILATRAPILLAPSMNVNMWQSPITQSNVRRLIELRGVKTVGPGDGFLACKWTGPGRLAEPVDIVEAARRVLTPQDLAGSSIVVTAGPTHEAIDPVRFVCNRSTGKMGYALAAAAARRGASVHLISGPTNVTPPVGVAVTDATDARSMDAEVRAVWRASDVVIMAAAVADFRPHTQATDKLKKSDLSASGKVAIPLVANPDILAGLGAQRRELGATTPILVGFAAETRDLLTNARAKLDHKAVDLIVANDVSEPDAGFAVDTNRVALVTRDQIEPLELAHKTEIAHRILDRVVALIADRPGS